MSRSENAAADSEPAVLAASSTATDAEWIASQFHEQYESQAPHFGYKTREASAVAWADVPEANKRLMVRVVATLLVNRIIDIGPSPRRPE